MPDLMILLSLPAVIALGVITSYDDYKYGKIRNKWVVAGILYAIAINLLIYLMLIFGGGEARISYLIELGVTFILSLLFGFIIWWIGLWTAGDAKLFAAYSLLVPLSIYRFGHIPYFSSSNILMNTFVPLFFAYSVFLIYKIPNKKKLFYLKRSLEPRQLVQLFIFLFGFAWLASLFFNLAGIPGNFFLSLFFLFILLILMERLFGPRLRHIMITIAILRILFDRSLLTIAAWQNLLFLLIAFIFLRFFLLYLSYHYLTKEVDINLLKPGLVPAELVYKEKGNYFKRPMLYFSLLTYMQERARKRDYVIDCNAEGLVEKDIKKLRSLKLGFEHLRVYNTLSFAPFLFAGVLLTYIFQGNVFISIAVLFQSFF